RRKPVPVGGAGYSSDEVLAGGDNAVFVFPRCREYCSHNRIYDNGKVAPVGVELQSKYVRGERNKAAFYGAAAAIYHLVGDGSVLNQLATGQRNPQLTGAAEPHRSARYSKPDLARISAAIQDQVVFQSP